MSDTKQDIRIIEYNNTLSTQKQGSSCFFGGSFSKGSVMSPTLITSPKGLINTFGEATNENYNDWYQCYNFLQYSNTLMVNRVQNSSTNSVGGFPNNDEILFPINSTEEFLEKYNDIPHQGDSLVKFIAKTPGSWGNEISISIISLEEVNSNVVIKNGRTVSSLGNYNYFKKIKDDEYIVFVFEGEILKETYIKIYDRFVEINIESNLIYVVARTRMIEEKFTPLPDDDVFFMQYDGNFYWFDGNSGNESGNDNFLGNDTYDGNDGAVEPIFYSSTLVQLHKGYQTLPLETDIEECYQYVNSVESYVIDTIIGNETNNLSAVNLANHRQDCIAFLSIPIRYNTIKEMIQYRNSLPDSNYVSLISNYKYQIDRFSDTYRWISFNGDICGLKSKSDIDNEQWFSFSKISNRILNVSNVKHTFDRKKQDLLYKNAINPIIVHNNSLYLSGQKLLLSKPSSINRVNIRSLINALERKLSKMARLGTFEINNEFTRNNLKVEISPYLDSVKSGRGIQNYMIRCDKSNNGDSDNKIVIDVYIQPTIIAEYVRLRVTNAGTRSFSDVSFRSS